jgi:serine/threonine-protein kinase HipA
MPNTVHISLCFGSETYQIGELSSQGGKSILAIHGLPFSIPGMAVGTTQFFDNAPPFWIRDILPDAWGEMVMLHEMAKAGIKRSEITLAHKLSYVGVSGLGAWQFQPEQTFKEGEVVRDVDWLREQAIQLLNHQTDVNLDWMVGSLSLGGARPKLFVDLVDGHVSLERLAKDRDWILKFPGLRDAPDDGNWEFMYTQIASKFGLNIPPHDLVNGKYFATKRFDKLANERFIVRTLSGINQKLHTDMMGNSYESAMDVVQDMSAERMRQFLKLAIFNAVMINRDDHAKNISYLFDKHGRIKDAPFYDLTYSPVLGVHGISLNRESWFGYHDVVEVFSLFGLSKKQIDGVISELQDILFSSWNQFLSHAGIELTDRTHQRQTEIFAEMMKWKH